MDTEKQLTPAEKHYQAQLRASKKYYRKTHPNPRKYVRKTGQAEPTPDPTKPEISGQNGLLNL